MKLIAHEEGRSLQLISADEMRPLRGGIFPIDALAKIIQRYRFTKHPNAYESGTTIKFETGVIVLNEITIPILSLDIYGDGILVSTRNTDESDLVLNEFMNWSIDEFGFREPFTIVPRKYVSRVVVDLDSAFEKLSLDFSVMSAVASELFDGKPHNLSMISLQIGPFLATQYPYQTTWNFGRRMTDPTVSNRYVSNAPLSSAAHLTFLETMERRLRSK